MASISHLIENNRAWAKKILDQDPNFFRKLMNQQAPEYFWIGCSDSRVPANQIVGLLPGDLFVHRNVANVVAHSDLNCLSVLQFAVDILKVKHVLVVGHYGCSGVMAALRGDRLGLSDNWLCHVRDIRDQHGSFLTKLSCEAEIADRLCEINVIEQVKNVSQSTIVRDAWDRGQKLAIHSWIYGVHDGHIQDLESTVSRLDDVMPAYDRSMTKVMSERWEKKTADGK